jgi:hypothetical protein
MTQFNPDTFAGEQQTMHYSTLAWHTLSHGLLTYNKALKSIQCTCKAAKLPDKTQTVAQLNRYSAGIMA